VNRSKSNDGKKKREKELRESLPTTGKPDKQPLPNRTASYANVEEEQEDRLEQLTKHGRLIRAQLPVMLKRLAKITDPRNPKKIKHKMASLFIYGILMFTFQFASRREVNRQMTRPQFQENLKLVFPELVQLPHADTLYRLLRDMEDINQLEDIYLQLLTKLIRKKKFRRYLIDDCYPVSVDGSQKLVSAHLWDENQLQRRVGKPSSSDEQAEGEVQECHQYYVYLLEAELCFSNGMVIPFFSEFLEYDTGDENEKKQDCELRAFHRLAKRIKKTFPRLSIMLLLDGLYANRPVIEMCRKFAWQYMIVLKDKSLPSVWEEIDGLLPYHPENNYQQSWGNRRQNFWWLNNIQYETSPNGKTFFTLYVVGCQESWQEIDVGGETVTKKAQHVWLSSCPLKASNLHERCNLGARHRWGIESNFLVEKRQGYSFEHCFATDWKAMKGYHLLMKIGHFFNVLARFTEQMSVAFATMGVRPLVRFIRETYAGPWLVPEVVRERLSQNFQLRLK
jgi:hypothetical protein